MGKLLQTAIGFLDKLNAKIEEGQMKYIRLASNEDSSAKRELYNQIVALGQPSQTFYKWMQDNLEDYEQGQIEGGFREIIQRLNTLIAKILMNMQEIKGA